MGKIFKGQYKVTHGGSLHRPMHFSIHSEELEDDMTDEDLVWLYKEAIREDFLENVTPQPEFVDEFVSWAREQLEKRDG